VVVLVVGTTVMVTPIVVIIVVTVTLSDIDAARSNIHADVGRRSGLRRCDAYQCDCRCANDE